MIVRTAEFKGSFASVDACPDTTKPEWAFIGRSNVGKSSLINMLVRRKGLVKVSSTPGKTQTINYFLINDVFHLVDLPGYGYAKVSKAERERFHQMNEAYIRRRKQLYAVFQLVDSRLDPQKADLEFSEQLAGWQVPFAIVFTKSDKNKRNDLVKNTRGYMQTLSKSFKAQPPAFVTSAETGEGRDKLWQYMQIHMPPEVGGMITQAV